MLKFQVSFQNSFQNLFQQFFLFFCLTLAIVSSSLGVPKLHISSSKDSKNSVTSFEKTFTLCFSSHRAIAKLSLSYLSFMLAYFPTNNISFEKLADRKQLQIVTDVACLHDFSNTLVAYKKEM